MSFIIHWICVITITLLVIYVVISLLYLKLELQAATALSTDKMPALKPVPIPTKHQKTVFHKLAVFVIEVRKWEVAENWHYQLNEDVELVIEKGFRFDGASIPRPFWAVLNPTGLLLVPGLLHDYGYRYNQIWQVKPDGKIVPYKHDGDESGDKDFWDKLFKQVGNDVNGFFLVNAIAWLAVALGGSSTWKEHRDNNFKPKKSDLKSS